MSLKNPTPISITFDETMMDEILNFQRNIPQSTIAPVAPEPKQIIGSVTVDLFSLKHFKLSGKFITLTKATDVELVYTHHGAVGYGGPSFVCKKSDSLVDCRFAIENQEDIRCSMNFTKELETVSVVYSEAYEEDDMVPDLYYFTLHHYLSTPTLTLEKHTLAGGCDLFAYADCKEYIQIDPNGFQLLFKPVFDIWG